MIRCHFTRARVVSFVLGCVVLAISMELCIPFSANAVTIVDESTAMDSEAYPETVQVPVTLYDYGCEDEDGDWVTKDPTVLNDGIPSANRNTTALSDIPKSMFFWDSSYEDWDDSSDYSSFVIDGDVYVGGYFSWGLFERTFTEWSDIIAVDSRDLFGTGEDSCSYKGTTFKQVYEDVLMDFSYDPDTNTYHYCSNESDATFDVGSNRIVKTEGEDGGSGFWPFGEGEVHFGLTMDFDFYLPSEKYLDNNEYYFAFSGDDDLVVYVDDVLALDLGGAHSAVAGYIDFANEIVVYSTDGAEFQREVFEASVAESDIEMITDEGMFEEAGVDWNKDTYGYVTFEELGIDLDASSEHNFKLAYLERGGDASNLTIEMNMQIQAEVGYEVVGDTEPIDELTDDVPVEDGSFDLYDAYYALPGLETEDDGYYFLGWYADEDCTELWEDGTLLTSAQTILYGKWVYAAAVKTSDPASGTTVYPGDTIDYSIVYSNNDSNSQTVVVTDSIPEYTTLVDGSVTCEGGSADLSQVEEGKGTIYATWDDVESEETIELTFQVTVDEDAVGQTVINSADLSIDDGTIVITTNETDHEVGESEVTVVDEGGESEEYIPVEVVYEEDVDEDDGEATLASSLPETGDSTTVGIVVALLGAVGAGIAFLLRAMLGGRVG